MGCMNCMILVPFWSPSRCPCPGVNGVEEGQCQALYACSSPVRRCQLPGLGVLTIVAHAARMDTVQQAWNTRDQALQHYYRQHPERFRTRPTTPAPAHTVGINLPHEKPQTKAA